MPRFVFPQIIPEFLVFRQSLVDIIKIFFDHEPYSVLFSIDNKASGANCGLGPGSLLPLIKSPVYRLLVQLKIPTVGPF
ncbi:hypothetical protein EFP47_05445 [Lactiplantibacillus pentosus]|nr:hypothetical protein [Lactiplantibacillus pentosus]